MLKIIKITLGSLFLIFIFFTAINSFYAKYTADVYFSNSEKLLEEFELEKALNNATLSIRNNPLEPNYYKQRAKVYLTMAAVLSDEYKSELKKSALDDMNTAYNINPDNLVTVRNLVPLFYFLSVREYTLNISEENIDRDFLPITKSYYEKIKNISPNDAGVYVLLAKYEKRLGLANEYNQSIKIVGELRPDLLEWHENFR
ncbi:hypothetical protein A3F07_03000 [candidate division WWE3 bacterium RIFCSPHIGHO2_12_FULL_38_15]|uniref:DUF5667 domain-containing protein n=1 Tax=candidate division WWE3 bacterium RIFCSPHIGHO2_02_FULL_38_14 TaxID=1802620 RepID=A0A1F4V9I8_UNCKA|nr:MAG: hypothetical protein A2793_01460 [candidate division WWE3 bacterium RIFCSPHIGHO2_01_FULL_38_45]OGC49439.1 MAG: hypothetical protein A3F07_03000 [candidate division WWE3 bacterium RIFCSPHIGHO2_12_FULL_38_15]OGC52751.1 MAG: hypothetical protein A3B64_01075 [candidate division WWE3 bacterium RIFCSPLOWO2_01_FULL_37_24]OGC53882.1 MAG: hypothetical protein A3D91_01460 [candidate division WWE3 bacterium RIFCSPHIGHO2_02_FULL_38_14]HLB52047.1 hypothetical protein [Patescibacteria group bacterium